MINNSILKFWKDALTANSYEKKPSLITNIKNDQIFCLNKLNSNEVYSILIESGDSKSFSQLFYKIFFYKIQVLIGKLYMCYLV